MTWTAPRTWVTDEIVTASIMNTHVRDNLLTLAPVAATVVTGESTASTSYVDVATVGPAVTLNTGTKALVTCTCQSSSTTANASAYMGFTVSGASTVAATDATAQVVTSFSAGFGILSGATFLVTGLTAGSNTFTAKYRVTAGTGSFARRHLVVADYPG